MQPREALEQAERSLRLVVAHVLGSTWQRTLSSEKLDKLREMQVEDAKRRDGAVAEVDLLSFTEFHQLRDLVLKNWEAFKPVFGDKKRTEVYLGLLQDYRNPVAHHRSLLPFERDLLSGVSSQLRNQVTIFRSSEGDPSRRFYPVIDTVTDEFGNRAAGGLSPTMGPRLEVGQVVRFDLFASDFQERPLEWCVRIERRKPFTGLAKFAPLAGGPGNIKVFKWEVKEADVGEVVGVDFFLRGKSRYHRHAGDTNSEAYDDFCALAYAVNPPSE